MHNLLWISDGVPIEEWTNEFILLVWLTSLWGKPKGNQVLTSAEFFKFKISKVRPEAGWATHDQGELRRKSREGPNLLAVQYHRMSCG